MKFKELKNVLSRHNKFNIMSLECDNLDNIECCYNIKGCFNIIDKYAKLYNLSDKEVKYITPSGDDELYIVLK